jgi:hypothetical protein
MEVLKHESNQKELRNRKGEFILSCKGLQRTMNIGEGKFEFIVGSKKYECERFQAAFISNKAHQLMLTDSTANSFDLGVEDARGVFEQICLLMRGCPVHFRTEDHRQLVRIAHALDNDELMSCVMETDLGQLGTSNCLSRLQIKEELGYDCEHELDYIASHFSELTREELKILGEFSGETIEAILSRENLCLRDEDALLDFVLGLDYPFLYGYVECQFLSLCAIRKFLGKIREFGLDTRIWESICHRMECEVISGENESKRFGKKKGEDSIRKEKPEAPARVPAFAEEMRSRLMRERPGITNSEADFMLAERWAQLSDAERSNWG